MKDIWLRLRLLMSVVALDMADRLAPGGDVDGAVIRRGIGDIIRRLARAARRRKMSPVMDSAK